LFNKYLQLAFISPRFVPNQQSTGSRVVRKWVY